MKTILSMSLNPENVHAQGLASSDSGLCSNLPRGEACVAMRFPEASYALTWKSSNPATPRLMSQISPLAAVTGLGASYWMMNEFQLFCDPED